MTRLSRPLVLLILLILLNIVLMLLGGCASAHYAHTYPDGQKRTIDAYVFGSTTALKDADMKLGDGEIHIGDAQQQQPLGDVAKALGQVAGVAARAAAGLPP